MAQSILVAEDNGDLRAWFRMVLEYEGYAVMEAANGREVMDILRRARVDLCITDLAMPEQEGIETIPMIRHECPKLKIMALVQTRGWRAMMKRCNGSSGSKICSKDGTSTDRSSFCA